MSKSEWSDSGDGWQHYEEVNVYDFRSNQNVFTEIEGLYKSFCVVVFILFLCNVGIVAIKVRAVPIWTPNIARIYVWETYSERGTRKMDHLFPPWHRATHRYWFTNFGKKRCRSTSGRFSWLTTMRFLAPFPSGFPCWKEPILTLFPTLKAADSPSERSHPEVLESTLGYVLLMLMITPRTMPAKG